MKKLLSLLTLLVAIVTGANADEVWTWNGSSTAPAKTTQTYASDGNSVNLTIKGNSDKDVITASEIDDFEINGETISTGHYVWLNGTTSDSRYVSVTGLSGKGKFYFRIYATSNRNISVGTATGAAANTDLAYIATTSSNRNNVLETDEIELDEETTYQIKTSGSMGFYAIAWVPAPPTDATVAPSTPNFSVDGDVAGGSTTTIVSENAQKVYYAWTNSATAPTVGDDAYTEATGASYEFKIPNETATMYLHAYGWNNYNTSSTSAVKTAQFTVTKDVTAPKSYNFAVAFSEEIETALGTNFTLKDNGRYESSASITKDTDIELGEYAASVWSGLIVGRSGKNIDAGSLRIMPNGYIQVNGGNGYFKIKNLKDGDVIKVRFQSSNQTSDRKFTVTGATETEIKAYASYKGYSEATITKSGNGDLMLKQDNGINLWTIAINEDLPVIADETISIDDKGVLTYVSNNALDFTGVTGLTAYIVTSVNDAKTSVATEAITGVVPSNTPLLIKGATSAVARAVATAESVSALDNNLLKASTGEGVQGADDIFAYSKDNKKFMKVATTVTIPAGKCYLQIEGVSGNALNLDFEGEATAVEAIAEADEAEAAPVKVIKNGKLYIGNFNVAGQQVK